MSLLFLICLIRCARSNGLAIAVWNLYCNTWRSIRVLASYGTGLFLLTTGCTWTGTGQNAQGVAMFQQGRFTEALQQFETAKQSDPTNPDTYYNLASTYHRVGNTTKDPKMLQNSEALYNQCLDLAPNHVDCHRGLAVLLVDTGRSDRAFTLLKGWAQKNPGLSDPRVELARLHQEFNQNKLAEQHLDEALAMDPNNSKAWAARGKLRENSGELMQAVQNYQQSLAINAKQPELFQRISSLNVRMAQGNSPSTGGTTIASTAGSPGNSPITPNIASNPQGTSSPPLMGAPLSSGLRSLPVGGGSSLPNNPGRY